ncbi:hypothetical protein JMY91_19440 [Brenneria goodwinii]|uniref:Uncharacterized protein n=1 Tax=Brenneria goodwinii TaxID=1109412 RepID=A0A0G4K355_9GAMM|nr:hypothetical protein [Brenneria goodwinii]CPR21487.1 hypothetical protein BN1221_04914c [Brenneria goodwinii]
MQAAIQKRIPALLSDAALDLAAFILRIRGVDRLNIISYAVGERFKY